MTTAMTLLLGALSATLALVAVVLLLPTVSDLLSLITAGARPNSPTVDSGTAAPRLLFLIPAHDEELLIGNTIASLRRVDYPEAAMDAVVIADNCSDATAEVARAAGATVLERRDAVKRGKPYAIEWALGRLPLAEYEAVVVIDADAVVDPGFARALAGAAPLRDKAAQTYNDVSNPTENALTRMAAVFSAARSVFMNGLKRRAGLNVPLANGLCLGTSVIARHGWQAFSICEDWELYAILTERGVQIDNVPGARVGAQEAKSLKQSSSQRQRWAAGKITVLRNHIGSLLRSREIGARQKLDVLAELTGFGPAVHAGLVVVLAALALVLRLPWGQWVAGLLLLSLARHAAYTLLAVTRDRQPARAMLAFTYLPFYTAWRLGVQLLALTMVGDKPWVRTQRHVESTATTPT